MSVIPIRFGRLARLRETAGGVEGAHRAAPASRCASLRVGFVVGLLRCLSSSRKVSFRRSVIDASSIAAVDSPVALALVTGSGL